MKRTHEIKIRFTEEELATLNKKVGQTIFSREAFCREILNGTIVRETPHADFYLLMREVKRVGSNIDQLLSLAYAKGFEDAPALRKALVELNDTERMLWYTFRPTEDDT